MQRDRRDGKRGSALSSPQTKLRRAPAKPAPREQVTLEFPDNAVLAALGGAHQRNLVRIEQKLGVRVAMRGNLVAVEGAADNRERAAQVLRALYARIEAGEEAGLAEVDAEIRFATHEPRAGRRAVSARRKSRPRRPASPAPARRRKPPISISCEPIRWCSASARPAPARPISPRPSARICCMSGGWSG